MLWFSFIATRATSARYFMVTVLITNLAIHSAWGEHTYIYFFCWHFQSCSPLSTTSGLSVYLLEPHYIIVSTEAKGKRKNRFFLQIAVLKTTFRRLVVFSGIFTIPAHFNDFFMSSADKLRFYNDIGPQAGSF